MKKQFVISALMLAALPVQAQRIVAVNGVTDCGQILFNHPVTAEYQIKNVGKRPLYIEKVKTSCGCLAVSYPKTAIENGAVATVKVTYDARQMGHFKKLIALYTNASKDPYVLRFNGSVAEKIVNFSGNYHFSLGKLLTDRDVIEFDDVNKGEIPQVKIQVKNPTTETSEPVVMHLPPYLSAEVSPSKIAPGHAGVITLRLDSRLLRDYGLTQRNVYLGFKPGDKITPETKMEVSAVLLPDFRDMKSMSGELVPHIELSANSLDLGSFGKKSKLKGVITISNEGKQSLRISKLQMFTPGLNVSLNKTKIESGEEAKLKITAIEKVLRRVRSKPRVLMITNDPEHSKIIIDINVKLD